MRLKQRRLGTQHRLVAVGTVALFGLAACGSGSGQTSNSAGPPHRGGTLKLVGTSDIDHMDTADAYYTVTNILLRAFTRQLVTYKATNSESERSVVVPDLATDVPSEGNGGVTDGGKTYTFHLRPDVMWNTSPPRPVTAGDVVLGMKRLCNPAHPVPAPGYYENTIVGFQEYCESFLKAPGTVSGISDFINSHDIEGVQATDDTTVVFHLNAPASDFINIMTLPFATPTPKEYLKYIPDSPEMRTHTISDGPYRITKYEANKEIDLDRNPVWKAGNDPLRKAYVNKITITEGIDSTAVQQQLEAGTADMEWDTNVPPPSLPGLFASADKRMQITGAGTTNPYVVFNFLSPNANKATSKLKVRQALEYAVNKKAIIQVLGGPKMGQPLDTFLTPEVTGHQQFNMYPTKGHQGDPAKAKKLLAEAGYPDGLTLKLLYSTADTSPKVAQTLQADLAKANITLKLVPATQSDFYSNFLQSPSVAKRGVWDIATPGWTPDWPGNSARSFIVPLLDGRTFAAGSTNYGDFNDPVMNKIIDKALSTPDANQAAKFWHQADMRAMHQAAVIPIREDRVSIFRASNVQNSKVLPLSLQGDITNVWLSN